MVEDSRHILVRVESKMPKSRRQLPEVLAMKNAGLLYFFMQYFLDGDTKP